MSERELYVGRLHPDECVLTGHPMRCIRRDHPTAASDCRKDDGVDSVEG